MSEIHKQNPLYSSVYQNKSINENQTSKSSINESTKNDELEKQSHKIEAVITENIDFNASISKKEIQVQTPSQETDKISPIISNLRLDNASNSNNVNEGPTREEIRHFFNNNPQCMNFILQNHLHYRIDNTYLDRGISPKIVKNSDGDLDFYLPVNKGTLSKEEVVWVKWSEIPMEQGKIKDMTFGPFGFENYSEDKFIIIRPIKIIPRSDEEAAEPRIELVSSHPVATNNPLASYGHSWIRFKLPVVDENGKPTSQDWIYSVGYRLQPIHSTLNTPDIHEFLNRPKTYTTVPIDIKKFEELKKFIELIQVKIRGLKIDDPEITDLANQIKNGTCANFAQILFNKAVPQEHQIGDIRGDNIQKIFSQSVADYVAEVTKPYSEYPILGQGLRAINMIMGAAWPEKMIEEQRKKQTQS